MSKKIVIRIDGRWIQQNMKINEQYHYEIAKVGSFDKFNIIIWMNDSCNIPHFHVMDANSNGDEFYTCIEIKKCSYFHHTGKEDILNSKQKKKLVEFLTDKCSVKRFSNFTNWEVLVVLWNMNNSDMIVDEDTLMPDYTKL